MKLQSKIIIILVLLVTIASPIISQKNYKIGNDTLVCYTKLENRKIAIIFQDRNKLEELNFNNEEIIFNLKDINAKLLNNIKQYNLKDSINNDINMKLNKQLYTETKSKNNWKGIGKTSITINILLSLILIF